MAPEVKKTPWTNGFRKPESRGRGRHRHAKVVLFLSTVNLTIRPSITLTEQCNNSVETYRVPTEASAFEKSPTFHVLTTASPGFTLPNPIGLPHLPPPTLPTTIAEPQETSTPTSIPPEICAQTGFDLAAVVIYFGFYFSSGVAASIRRHMEHYLLHLSSQIISNSRCFRLLSFTESYDHWPVMTWNEGDMEVLRLFLVDSQTHFCNFLTHYGRGKRSFSNGKNWEHSAISWQVNDLTVLKALCIAAQHLTWRRQSREDEILSLPMHEHSSILKT